MGIITFFDSVDADALPQAQTHGLFYVDGKYANEAAVRHRLPHARLIGLTVAGNIADGCDCEHGDLTETQTVAWVAQRVKAGQRLVIVYASRATWDGGLKVALAHHGNRIRRWVADYDGKALVPAGFDAHQYAGNVKTRIGTVDKNIASELLFEPWQPPKPSGVAKFEGTVDLDTGQWTIRKLHGTATFHGQAAAYYAQIKIDVSDSYGARASIHGVPKP